MRAEVSRQLLRCTLVAVLLAGCQPSEQLRETSTPSYPRIGNAPALVPSMSDAALPDFGQINDVASKKSAFFGFLRPLVAHQNQHMQTLREHLLRLNQGFKAQGGLHPDDRAWLVETAELFRVDSEEPAEQLARLQRKIGQIPVAMVLAQAANESAWGTSRFARQGNNLFGMWCFRPGCGLAPLQRDEGATHEVAAYASVEEGIYRYLINLNANSSYRDLRGIRQCLRQQQRPLSGRAMAAGLTGYSERGSHYVEELRSMIRINRLEPWKRDWWGDQAPDNPCYGLVQVSVEHPDPILAEAPASDAAASGDLAASGDPAASAATPSTRPSASPPVAGSGPTSGASLALLSGTPASRSTPAAAPVSTAVHSATPGALKIATALSAAPASGVAE